MSKWEVQVEREKGRKNMEYYFESEKTQKKGLYLLMFSSWREGPSGKEDAEDKKEKRVLDKLTDVRGRNETLKPHQSSLKKKLSQYNMFYTQKYLLPGNNFSFA